MMIIISVFLCACTQEQAVEREHERDEFQQEIHRLEAQLRQTSRGQASGDIRGQRVRSLHPGSFSSTASSSHFTGTEKGPSNYIFSIF